MRNCGTWWGADIRRGEGSLVVSGRSFLSNDAAKEVEWDDLEEHITWWLRFFHKKHGFMDYCFLTAHTVRCVKQFS